MSEYGQPQSNTADLEAQHLATWSSYTAMQPAPGWQQASIDAAAAAARAKFALDKANGYTR
jgi:hypothetical protein